MATEPLAALRPKRGRRLNAPDRVRGAERRMARLGTILWMSLAGLVIGGLVGWGLGIWLPAAGMSVGAPLGFSPTTLSLGVVHLTVGLQLTVNVTGLIGLLIGFILGLRHR